VIRLHLDPDLARRVRHAAVDKEMSLSEFGAEILQAALARSASEPTKVAK
jgi:hypothetical protein